jgi:hypothetical protein
VAVGICLLAPASALALDPEQTIAPGGKWISGDIIQQIGENCSVLGNPYTEVMVSGIASYGGQPGVPVVGQRYYTSFMLSIPGNPCGPGSSSVETTLVLPPHTEVDTSAPIRCFGIPRNQNDWIELTGGSWSFEGYSGPYCPTSGSPSALHQGGIDFGFRPLANGQLFEIFVPVKSSAQLVGAGTSPADGFRWLTDATGVYANPGLSTVWANVFPSGTSSGPFVYFAHDPAIPFWKGDAPAGAENRVELWANLYTAGLAGTLCYKVYRLSDMSQRADCSIDPGYNGTVPAGLSLAQVLPGDEVKGPNGGYAPFYFDPPAEEWGKDMRITWTFTPSSGPPVSSSADFHTLPGPDSDGDGVADVNDTCPSTKGTQADGCMPPPQTDPDGDGVYGDADKCPDANGSGALNGCPGGVVPSPSPGPSPGPGPQPLPTTLSGSLKIKRNAKLKRASLLKGSKVGFTCTRDSTATATLAITKKTAKKLHVKARKPSVTLASGKGTCTAAGGGSLKLKVAKKYARAVRRAHRAFPGTLGLVLAAGSDRATLKTPVKVG